MNRLILICCLMILGFGAFAQQADVSEVTIDTLTKKGNKSAPFDKSFVLKVPFDKKPELNFLSVARIDKDGEERRVSERELKKFYHWLKFNGKNDFEYDAYDARISKARYDRFLKNYGFKTILNETEIKELKNKYKGNSRSDLSSYLKDLEADGKIDQSQKIKLSTVGLKNKWKKGMPTYLKIPLESIQYKKQGTKQLATFEMFPIEPDKSYRMQWMRKSNDKEFQAYFEFLEANCNQKAILLSNRNLQKEYDSLKATTFLKELPSKSSLAKKSEDHCDGFNTLPTYNQIESVVTGSAIDGFVKCTKSNEALHVLLNKSLPCKECGNCENCGKEVKTFKENLKGLVPIINNLYSITGSYAKSYLLGYLPLNHKSESESLAQNKIYQRIANFNSTKKSINALLDELKTLNTNQRSSVIAELITCLENLQIGIFKQMDDKYSEYTDFKSDVQKHFETFKLESGNEIRSDISDFDTRSKLQIVPTFGLITYGFSPKSNVPDFLGVTPYLGFQINLRPIDKNIPLKNIPYKSIWHRLSVQAGWTLISLKEDGLREDLFKNRSFMTGLGFKLSNAVSLSSGVVFFKEVDPNPLINETSTAVTPYVGLSIDLDIADYLNDFTSIFK